MSPTTVPPPSLVEVGSQPLPPAARPDHLPAVSKQRILSGAIPPGERLVEKVLCDELGVSRSPLNRSNHEELVVLQPTAGYRVSLITLHGFETLTELRATVPQTAAQAATRATPSEVREWRALAALPHAANDGPVCVELWRANARFHRRFAHTTGNPWLENIVMSALDLSQRPPISASAARSTRRTPPRNTTRSSTPSRRAMRRELRR